MKPAKKRAPTLKSLSFQSRLERISSEMDYFALPVPAKITRALGIRGAVPITARVNDSPEFRGSLVPTGDGAHFMRVKLAVRKAAGIEEGDRARVTFKVVNRHVEAAELPKDLASALRAEGVLKEFEALPPGKRGFLIRLIDAAAKPETRAKRIQDAVDKARGAR